MRARTCRSVVDTNLNTGAYGLPEGTRMATISLMKSGTTSYTHGTPYRGAAHGSYYRKDVFHSTTCLDGEIDCFVCEGLLDDSPPFDGRYDDAHCPCCWLGHPHTTAYHAAHQGVLESNAR